MTAVIHHGPPGSYKSFSIVQDVVIPALLKGRTVCTNIRGLNSISRISKIMELEFPESAKLVCVKHDSEEGFQHMARFFQWAPVGALIVMDEGQRVYPTRLKSLAEFDTPAEKIEVLDSGVQRPTTVENAFDQHRHMNWDIYISTPNIAKIHKEVRSVAEFGYRHREMSGALPWWKNCWREFKHDPEQSGKSISHYIGQPVRRKADPRIFECYQSTATGKAKGSNENKSVLASPKLRIFAVFIVLGVGYFIYGLSQVMPRFMGSDEVSGIESLTSVPAPARDVSTGSPDPGRVQTVPDVDAGRQMLRDRGLTAKIPDYDRLPESRRWKLTGVILGNAYARSYALIGSENNTRQIDLDNYCFYSRFELGWVCIYRGEVIADYTGPVLINPKKEMDSKVTLLDESSPFLTAN